MRLGSITRLLSQALLPCLAVLAGGCGLIDVDMTSTPANVRYGEPVTFDIKLTNRSQCPTKTAVAVLQAFIPLEEFNAEFDPELPPDAPPELIELLQKLRAFFDALCSGGEPTLPELSASSTSCARGEDAVVCTATGPAPAQQAGGGGLTFATLGDRLRCDIDAGTMRCVLRVPLPAGPAAANGAAPQLATQALSCLTAVDLGIDPVTGEGDAVCFIGTFPNFQGLAPAEMATGQVTLPARGSGVMRNLIYSMSDEAEALGVCKGGTNAGAACDRDDDSTDCQGGSCAEGICVGGGNAGRGCDEATAGVDCPSGSCELCSEPTGTGFLPLDCTTTYVAPNPAPTASPWGLAALAVALFGAGMFWLQRRRVR